jgi:hypothetical protein
MPVLADPCWLYSLADDARQRPGWQEYGAYLGLRAEGRRKEALRRLPAFLAGAERWSFIERLAFVQWLDQAMSADPRRALIPVPLVRRLLTPTCSEWLEREPDSAKANYFYATYVPSTDGGRDTLQYLRRAFALDAADQRTRIAFIRRVIGRAELNQHELPYFPYDGSASEDFRDLEDAVEMLQSADRSPQDEFFEPRLAELVDTARAWMAFEQMPDAPDFARFCLERGGPAAMLERLR